MAFSAPRVYGAAKWPGAGRETLVAMGKSRLCILNDVYSNSAEAHCSVYQVGGDWFLSVETTNPDSYKRCGASCFD